MPRENFPPLRIHIKEGGDAVVEGGVAKTLIKGEWRQAGDGFVVVAKLAASNKSEAESEPLETYKYFLEWAADNSNDLVLKKIVLMKPFLKMMDPKGKVDEFSLVFEDNPKLKLSGT